MNSRARPRKLKLCSIQIEPFRSARRSANTVAISNAMKARCRFSPLIVVREAAPSSGRVDFGGNDDFRERLRWQNLLGVALGGDRKMPRRLIPPNALGRLSQ